MTTSIVRTVLKDNSELIKILGTSHANIFPAVIFICRRTLN